MKVRIESTSHTYKEELKEFDHLENAIWYCWNLVDKNHDYADGIIVSKPFNYDFNLKKFVKSDHDFDLEIYDGYRE